MILFLLKINLSLFYRKLNIYVWFSCRQISFKFHAGISTHLRGFN